MLLYAEKTYLVYFNYFKKKVKKFKYWSKSAGNITFKDNGTSETLRNKTIIRGNLISACLRKNISTHVPTYRSLSIDDFSHYLAGIIDSCGSFTKNSELILIFKPIDISLAYYIKKRLGYGSVRKVLNKNVIALIISKEQGIQHVLYLINNKMRSVKKLNQINKHIFNPPKITLNKSSCLKNYWLSGVSDILGYFNLNRGELFLKLELNNDKLLSFILQFLGGTYEKSFNSYTYKSNNLVKIIGYFDKYHLLSKKHVDYLKFRKRYLKEGA